MAEDRGFSPRITAVKYNPLRGTRMRRYISFTVFFSGMTTLAAEFGASRLLQMRFGSVNLVWAVIIGLILVYFAAGYFIGGRQADKSPHPETLFTILAWGGGALGFIPIVAHPILLAAAAAMDALNLGIIAASFLATLLLFSLPVTLLAMSSPFAIRITLEDTGQAGNVSGNLYALSTIGSVLGAFLPTLLLFPLIGTSRTILLFGLVILLVAMGGLGLGKCWKKTALFGLWAVLLVIYLFIGDFHIKNSPGQVFERESQYNYIEVQQQNGFTLLRLNDGQGIHSIYHPDQLYYNGPWEQFLVGPFFNAGFTPEQVQRYAIIGLAAGTSARQASEVFPSVIIDGFEIDSEIVSVGQKYFDMNMPTLNVFIEDGRWGLEHSSFQYNLIAVDAYRPPYIPPHMTTVEFFQIVHDHLADDGVLAINVGRAPGDRRLIDGLSTTIATIFPSIHIMDIPNTLNSIVYASKHTTSTEDLFANYNSLISHGDVHPLLLTAMSSTIVNIQPGYKTTQIFTDDIAPIEWLTNNLIVNFLLHGDMGGLQ
jgi:predicted membrane-bound spermidine synthase